MRKLLLAGLVGFTLVGFGSGVAQAATPKVDTHGHDAWSPSSSPKSAKPKPKVAKEDGTEKPPEIAVDSFGCDLSEGPVAKSGVTLVVTNPNTKSEPKPGEPEPGEPEAATLTEGNIEYTVILYTDNPASPVRTQKLPPLGPGETNDEVVFEDIPAGEFIARAISGNDPTLFDDTDTEPTKKINIDQCNEIKTPVTKENSLQAVSRCNDGKGDVIVRVFGVTKDPKEYLLFVNDVEVEGGKIGPLSTEPASEDVGRWETVRFAEPFPDDTYKLRATAPGGVELSTSVTVKCAAPPVNPAKPAPQAKPASTGLADTGASVGWLAVVGVGVLGLGGGLLFFARRRRSMTSE